MIAVERVSLIPLDHYTLEGKEIHPDSKEFVSAILFRVLNTMGATGEEVDRSDFLQVNDMAFCRGTNVVILTFSRMRKLPVKPTVSEFKLSELIENENTLKVQKAEMYNNKEWHNIPSFKDFTSPFSVIFPVSHLSLTGDNLKNVHQEIANLLIPIVRDEIDRKNRLVKINPIFSGRDFLLDEKLCFMLMPFKEPFTGIYEKLIKPAVEAEGFHVTKSNDIFSTSSVIEDIWENINKASLIIAEITGNNPNVMYELGICHTLGKNVMMITQNASEIPFNFRHMRCYPYTNDIAGSEDLKKSITSVLQHIKSTRK